MANLSPELLALLRQQDAQTYNKMIGGSQLNGGRYYQPQYVGGKSGEDYDPGTLAGYTGYDQSWGDGGKHYGEKGQFYNADGSFSNEFDWKDDDWKKNLMLALAAAGGMAFLPGGALSSTFGQGTMAAQAGLEGAAGATGAGSGMVNGAFLGEAPWAATGGGALDFGASAAAGGAAGGGAAAGGGLLSSLGGASSLLGPAATVLGGLAGSQGQKTSQTSERKTDPRVDPYLFGDGTNPGLLGYTQQLLARQMAPGGLAGYDQMQTVGRGLMGAPVAGNGFNLLTGRR